MWLAALGLVFAADPRWRAEIATPEGALSPGVPGTLWVSVTDDLGRPPAERPRLLSDDGAVRILHDGAPAGVWAWRVTPEPGINRMSLELRAPTWSLPVTVPTVAAPVSVVGLAGRVPATAADGRVRVALEGPDLAPGALDVAVGGGATLVRQVAGADGTELEIGVPEVVDPRFFPVGARDGRGAERPRWGTVALEVQRRAPVTTEPGARVSLRVGSRVIGPVVAGADGVAPLVVTLRPGDTVGTVEVTDRSGNTATSRVQLATAAPPALGVLVGGRLEAGEPAPPVWVAAFAGDGVPWRGPAPVCTSSRQGALSLVPIEAGQWRLILPDPEGEALAPVRGACALPGAAEATFEVSVNEARPIRLDLRVWPEEISPDVPVADVQVSLENALGDRVVVERVSIGASHGETSLVATGGLVARGEYRPRDGAEVAEDVLVARWDAAPGTGAIGRIVLGNDVIPTSGPARIYARLLDRQRRPLAGAPVRLGLADAPVLVQSGPDGWAEAEVEIPHGVGPVRIVARTEQIAREELLPRGAARRGGPGTPDLATLQPIRLAAGRVVEVRLSADPIIPLMPEAVGHVRVALLDRSGRVIPQADVTVTASEGAVQWVSDAPGGEQVFEYTPPTGGRPRKVVLTATSAAAGVSASTEIQLDRPVLAPVARALGVSGGVTTNFAGFARPLLSVDHDVRLSFLARPLMLRVGGAWFTTLADVEAEGTVVAAQRTDWFPLQMSVLYRADFRGQAIWGGAGLLVAPWFGANQWLDGATSSRSGVLPPGVVATGGFGVRLLGGELAAELRLSTLFSPGTDVSARGQVGGVGAVIGYRVTY